jgi:hypothetical protein
MALPEGENRLFSRQFESFCVLTLWVPGHMIRGFSSTAGLFGTSADTIQIPGIFSDQNRFYGV